MNSRKTNQIAERAVITGDRRKAKRFFNRMVKATHQNHTSHLTSTMRNKARKVFIRELLKGN